LELEFDWPISSFAFNFSLRRYLQAAAAAAAAVQMNKPPGMPPQGFPINMMPGWAWHILPATSSPHPCSRPAPPPS
jgi:hypothetical protein